MNYIEEYPRCAECPFVKHMQMQRDSYLADFEAAELTTLDHDVRRESLKAEWIEAEVEIMKILDLVEQGAIDRDDPQLKELIDTLPAVYALHDMQENLEGKSRAALGSWKDATDELTEAQDALVRLTTDYCSGPRMTWLRHVVRCGSPVRTWRERRDDTRI